MKIIAVYRRLIFGCLGVGLFFSQVMSAQQHAPAKQDGGTPTIEEAKAFTCNIRPGKLP